MAIAWGITNPSHLRLSQLPDHQNININILHATFGLILHSSKWSSFIFSLGPSLPANLTSDSGVGTGKMKWQSCPVLCLEFRTKCIASYQCLWKSSGYFSRNFPALLSEYIHPANLPAAVPLAFPSRTYPLLYLSTSKFGLKLVQHLAIQVKFGSFEVTSLRAMPLQHSVYLPSGLLVLCFSIIYINSCGSANLFRSGKREHDECLIHWWMQRL